MPRRPRPPLERAARALCRHDGLPENITFEGRPMWESYLSKARAVLVALLDGASEDERAMVDRWLGLDAPIAPAPTHGRDKGGE